MNKELLAIYILFVVVLVIIEYIIIIKNKIKLNEATTQLKKREGELLEYKIREISPIPSMQKISYNDLKEKVNKYKPPYEIGQRVIYNDRTYVRIGYISGIKTEHCEIINPDNESKELVITHTYEIEDRFYTDIIDVVKE